MIYSDPKNWESPRINGTGMTDWQVERMCSQGPSSSIYGLCRVLFLKCYLGTTYALF
jgi:hypothetical protein